ncbi:MAG: hypothetical protein Q9209_004494 [Squamulea sp. 1 TL-2023]
MSRTITSKQWEERKEEILRLYIVEGLALKPVMRAMRAHDFDPSESQYRTRLKKWQRRKARNHHQRASNKEGNAESIVHPPLRLATSEADQSSSQHCVLAPNSFNPSTTSERTPTLSPKHTPFRWNDGAIVDGDQAEAGPVDLETIVQESTGAQIENTFRRQHVMPLNRADEELYQGLPDAWRKDCEERRKLAASAYTSITQPRIERDARTTPPISRPSKDQVPRVVDTNPTTLQVPLQPLWIAQQLSPGNNLPPPQNLLVTESSWWYGVHNNLNPSMPGFRSDAADADLLQLY